MTKSETSTTPGALSVWIGESPPASGELPQITIEGVHLSEEPASWPSAEGTVVNHSALAHHELVIFAVARREGKIVAPDVQWCPTWPRTPPPSFRSSS